MIVTFYSYKGGVGRSFCLANVAVQLARWGNRVLCVDFDLDAPGLHEYFKPYIAGPVVGGLVEVIGGKLPWEDYTDWVRVPDAQFLSLLAAGRMDSGYADRAQELSWPDLFAQQNLGWRFEKIRVDWEKLYDFVLIDSRTGITDIGGICTAQLPDVLVLCVAPNQQNIAGALEVAQRAAATRDKLPYDRAGLLYLPVVSRFDSKEEYERARSWRTRMAEQFAPLYASWMPKDQSDDNPELGLIERTTVPYQPYWSFGEEIAVLDERSSSPDSVSYYMDNIAALLAHRLADADVLVSNRDTYVSAARDRGRREPGHGFRYDVLVHGSSERAVDLTNELVELGVRAVRGRLAELSAVRTFVIVDPPEHPSPGVQEILDQDRLVMVAASEVPRQLIGHQLLPGRSGLEIAINVVIAIPAEEAGHHWGTVLVAASRTLQATGDLATAHMLATRAVEAARTSFQASLLRAELSREQGWLDEAEADLNRVLGAAEAASPEATRAHLLLGEIHRDKGNIPAAVHHFAKVVNAGSARERALAHLELAHLELRAGDAAEAQQHLVAASESSAGDPPLAARVAFELGSVLVDLGDFDGAGRQLAQAVERNTLTLDDQLTALRQLAYLENMAEQPHVAENYLQRALDLPVRPDDKADIIIELTRLRRDNFGIGQAISALELAVASLDHTDLIGQARLHEKLGNLYLEADDKASAEVALAGALRAFRRLGDRAGEVRSLIGLAAAHRNVDPAKSIGNWQEAHRLLTRLRGPEADLLWRQLDAVDPK